MLKHLWVEGTGDVSGQDPSSVRKEGDTEIKKGKVRKRGIKENVEQDTRTYLYVFHFPDSQSGNGAARISLFHCQYV